MPAQEHAPSYYAASTNRSLHYASLQGDRRCDVCVIGGGFTGLGAALNLAQRGLKVVLLEANKVGWGASGRNGGQVGGEPRKDMAAMEASYGKTVARQHWDLNYAALEEVKSLIATHDIDCDWRDGIINACHRQGDVSWYQTYVGKLQAEYGAAHVDFIPTAEMPATIGTDRYYGGMIDHHSGHFHPLNFALGLAQAATTAGAGLFENSRVISYDRNTPTRVKTANGTVTADYVVLACNGYLEKLEPRMAGRIMPINNFVIATEPLPAPLIPSGAAVADTRFVVNYWRQIADHRLLFGGGENYSRKFPQDIKAFVRRYMIEAYPQLQHTRIDYGWGGTLAITLNRMPHFGRLEPNIYFAQGYSGHGVALATFAGKLIAEALAGDSSRFDQFAKIPIRRFPGGTLLRWPGLVAGMLFYSLRDRM